MDNTKKLCESCRFFAESGSKNYCHRYPPQACVIDDQGSSATVYRIPEVHEKGYCGEWQEAQNESANEDLILSASQQKD